MKKNPKTFHTSFRMTALELERMDKIRKRYPYPISRAAFFQRAVMELIEREEQNAAKAKADA